ncbi:MAG: HEPN domain-containing protein [Thermodesulfobacteria bacterium]|nr:HEPN domain-containing protein [Thermodesulfobacteriota bacterium]
MLSRLFRRQKGKEAPELESQRSSSWLASSLADLKKAEELLKEDPDLAAFLAWQAARKAFKALEKKAGRSLSESSFVKLLAQFPEGQYALKPVKDAALFLDHFRRLAKHDDLFQEVNLGLGPLEREDARRVIEAARLLINFLEHRLK